MGLFDRIFGASSRSAGQGAQRYDFGDREAGSVLLVGNDRFDLEVVGEAHCQEELSTICGGPTEDGVEHSCVAVLAFDNGNEYDSDAVAIFVDGHRVGYLPRAVAKAYRQEMQRLNARRSPVGCRAIIRGGWDRGDADRGHFGIALDIAQPMQFHTND